MEAVSVPESDYQTYIYTTPGNWWSIAAHINALLDLQQRKDTNVWWVPQTTTSGITWEGYHIHSPEYIIAITIFGSEDRTTITVIEALSIQGFWKALEKSIELFTTMERAYQRHALGWQGDEDDYKLGLD